MTNQEAFDKMVAHLRKQGAKSMQDTLCMYRGENGMMCAVGCLIPDSEYSDDLEGIAISDMAEKPDCLEGFNPDMIDDMQTCHDQHDVEKWEASFERIALRFNLKLTPREETK